MLMSTDPLSGWSWLRLRASTPAVEWVASTGAACARRAESPTVNASAANRAMKNRIMVLLFASSRVSRARHDCLDYGANGRPESSTVVSHRADLEATRPQWLATG